MTLDAAITKIKLLDREGRDELENASKEVLKHYWDGYTDGLADALDFLLQVSEL